MQAATGRPVSAADLQKAVGQHLGDEAPLAAASWDLSACDLGAGLFVPAAAVKEARRQAVAALLQARRTAALATAEGMEPERDVLGELLSEIQQAGDGSDDTPAAADGAAVAGSVGAAAGTSDAAAEAAAEAAGAEQASTSGRGDAALPVLRVLCRSKAQVDAALTLPWLQEVVLDFLEVRPWGGSERVSLVPSMCFSCSTSQQSSGCYMLHGAGSRTCLLFIHLLTSFLLPLSPRPPQVHGLKEACAAVRAAGCRVVVATPRILKPDEQRLWLFYLRLGADALLLRSAGVLQRLTELGGPGEGRMAGQGRVV